MSTTFAFILGVLTTVVAVAAIVIWAALTCGSRDDDLMDRWR